MLWVLGMNAGLVPSHLDAVEAAIRDRGMPLLRRPEWVSSPEGNMCAAASPTHASVTEEALADGLEGVATGASSEAAGRTANLVFLGKRRVASGLDLLVSGHTASCVVLPAASESLPPTSPATSSSSAASAPALASPSAPVPASSSVFPGATLPPHCVVLSGSFNPLHGGHEALLDAAVATAEREAALLRSEAGAAGCDGGIQLTPVLEMSVRNADKGTLDPVSLRQRVEQLSGAESPVGESPSLREVYPASATGASGRTWPLLLTAEPYFPDKAAAMRGCWMVIGYDTAVRLCDPKYFGGTVSGVARALSRIQSAGCRILVAARAANAKDGSGAPLQLDGE